MHTLPTSTARAGLLIFSSCVLLGQTVGESAFDVASVKVSAVGGPRGRGLGSIRYSPDTPETIQLTGDIKQPLTLSATDLAKLPRAEVRTTSNGMEVVYQGVWLHEVLRSAGVPLGSELRGKALSIYVLAVAQDGYQVLFSLGELDPAFIDNQILLADTANGKPLFGAQGRFRLVVPNDKPGARSVRMLTRIEVVRLRK